MKSKGALLKSFVFSFLYVGLGTISLYSSRPGFFLSGDWAVVGLLLTMPGSGISFGVFFMEPENHELVWIIQITTFFILWIIAYQSMKKNKPTGHKIKRKP